MGFAGIATGAAMVSKFSNAVNFSEAFFYMNLGQTFGNDIAFCIDGHDIQYFL